MFYLFIVFVSFNSSLREPLGSWQSHITNCSLLILKVLLPIAVLVSQGLEALGRAPQHLRLRHNVAVVGYRRAHLIPADKAWGGEHNLLGSPLAER